LALSTEGPTPVLLERPPHGRFSPLITYKMIRQIAGHSIFQLAVLFFTLYGSQKLAFLRLDEDDSLNTTRNTIVFNTFVFMQVFNEFNTRKLANELNPFEGLSRDYIFMGVMSFTVIVQFLLVQFAGRFAQTTGLDGAQWGYCLMIAALTFPLGSILRFIPTPPESHGVAPIPVETVTTETKATEMSEVRVELDDHKTMSVEELQKKVIEADKELRKQSFGPGEDPNNNSNTGSRRGSRRSMMVAKDRWQMAGRSVQTQLTVLSALRKPLRGRANVAEPIL